MSCHEIKTFEWKCDSCGQKILTQGRNENESRPEEFGLATLRGVSGYSDVCVNCWPATPERGQFIVPKILTPILQKVS